MHCNENEVINEKCTLIAIVKCSYGLCTKRKKSSLKLMYDMPYANNPGLYFDPILCNGTVICRLIMA